MRALAPALRWFAALALILPSLVYAIDAFARPGGGQGFSGGGSSGGGSSGGSDDAVGLLIWLIFHHPKIGVPVAIVVFIVWQVNQRSKSKQRSWSTTTAKPPVFRRAAPRKKLEGLRQTDPDFSLVLFEDFLYALYARAHEARGAERLGTLAAYISEGARATLASFGVGRKAVHSVVVGAMSVDAVDDAGPTIHVNLTFEANYTEALDSGDERTWYTIERWRVSRSKLAKSPPPDRVRNFSCPNCGGSTANMREPVCAHCDTRVDTGAFDWVVSRVQVSHREPRGPTLTGTTPERGTDRPTIVDTDRTPRLDALRARDPAFQVSDFEARVKLIHRRLNETWSKRDLKPARPFVTDQLFQMQTYWVETYRRAGLTNKTTDVRVTAIEVAAVTSDRWFDAITVRLFATGHDFTVDAQGKVVGGSKDRLRPYSEYWTLIRGSSAKGAAKADPSCANCGAELSVNMAGVCDYCDTNVTTGDFDWVLSRIEQDESYRG